MSCTVVAIPVTLAWVVGHFVAASALGVGLMIENSHSQNTTETNLNKNNLHSDCTNPEHITEQNFIEKDFETPFNSKETLLKTITEHGLENIEETDNIITGRVNGYILKFEKKEENKPYNLTIYCDKNADAEEKMQNLSEEYALNVQEESYLSVVENLKKNNMEIEEEEILEDNSIVLTINLD